MLEKGAIDGQPFSIICQSSILTASDLNELNPLREELCECFEKVQIFRTRTEAEVSVLNNIKHPTPASKYWQSMREQNVHFHELVMLSFEYRKELVELTRLDNKILKESDPFESELMQIDKEKRTFILRNMERTAKDRIREIKMWSDIKAREARQMTEGDLADVDNHQLKSYTLRFINMSKVMGNNGSPAENQNLLGQLNSAITECIKRGVLEETISALPEKDQAKIFTDYGYTQLTGAK